MHRLTLAAMVCFGALPSLAVPVNSNLTLVDEAGFNGINIAIDVPTIGGDSDTSDLSGNIGVSLEIDPQTDQVSELTVINGSVTGSGVRFSRNIIVASYTVTASTIGAVLATPSPPGVVDPGTGDFDAAQHSFTVNSGTLNGSLRVGLDTTTIPPVDFATIDPPVTGPGTGTGHVSLVETGRTATSKTYEVVVTMPVSLDGEFEASPGQVVGVVADGTVKAAGSVTVPVNPYDVWAEANGIGGAAFDGDANGDGVPNGLQWALGLADDDDPWPHVLKPGTGGFEIVLPAGGSVWEITVVASDNPGVEPFVALDPSAVGGGNPIPAGTAGTVTVDRGSGGTGYLRLEVSKPE